MSPAESDNRAPEEESTTDVVFIWRSGDLVLDVYDETRDETFSYRVSTQYLRQASPYFNRLLDSTKFGEGTRVAEELSRLKKSYPKPADAPTKELPKIQIVDVGRISSVTTIKNLVADLLHVLHDRELSVAPSIPNLANLAVVADRFDALPPLARYINRRRSFQMIDARLKGKFGSLSEERVRQMLLIGLLLDHSAWVSSSSKRLIVGGSVRWKLDAPDEDNAALWWDLPRGIEEELISRREYVSDTLQSLGGYFVELYSSRNRQCRLGYESSAQCDSFQLGEMIRFFTRINVVDIEGALCGKNATESYSGNIERVLDLLRQCPEYQIDTNHKHCGLRKRLIPSLDQLEPYLRMSNAIDVGICSDCWQTHRSRYAWNEAKRPLSWHPAAVNFNPGKVRASPGSEACLELHLKVRDEFTATSRHWTGDDAVTTMGVRFGSTTPFLKLE